MAVYYESYYGVNSLGSDYLMHHGIKGQKWGIRRFQNEDGSYTEAGKRRRGNVSKKERRGLSEETKARIKKGLKVAGTAAVVGAAAYGAYKLSSSTDAKNAQKVLAIKKLSDEDLLAKIGRLEREKKLLDLGNELDNYAKSSSKASKIMSSAGETAVKSVVTAGTVLAAKKMVQRSLNAAGFDGDRILREMYPKKK